MNAECCVKSAASRKIDSERHLMAFSSSMSKEARLLVILLSRVECGNVVAPG